MEFSKTAKNNTELTVENDMLKFDIEILKESLKEINQEIGRIKGYTGMPLNPKPIKNDGNCKIIPLYPHLKKFSNG